MHTSPSNSGVPSTKLCTRHASRNLPSGMACPWADRGSLRPAVFVEGAVPAPHSAQEALSTQSHSCHCTVPVKAPNRRRSTATVTRVAPSGTGIMPNLRRPAGRAARSASTVVVMGSVLLDEIDGSNRLSPRLRLPGRLRLRLRDDGEAIEAPLAAEEKVVQQMARARPVRALVNRPSRPPRRKVGRDSSDYRIPFGIRTRVLQILHDVTLAARISPPMCRPTPSAKAAAPPGGGHRVMVRRKTLLVTTGSTDVLSKSAETRTSVVASTIQSGPRRP